jgi:5'-3' exonuclease
MVQHDYDFDYRIYLDIDNIVEKQLTNLYEFMKINLPKYNENYTCELIKSYPHKMEIFDPTHGKHSEHLADDFYNVILDLQLYKDDKDDPLAMRVQYFKHDSISKFNFKKE